MRIPRTTKDRKVDLIVETLECRLSNEELNRLKVNIVDIELSLERLHKKHEEEKRRFEEACNDYSNTIAAMRATVRAGIEKRDVECVQVSDFKTKKLSVSRRDTGEVLRSRNLRVEELQAELELPVERGIR